MSRPSREVRPIDLQARGPRNVSPLELGLIELPTRPRSEYTAKVRRDAILAADMGIMRDAADLTRAAMTESGYARGILADLTHGLWGLPRTFIGRADMIADLDDTPERIGQWRTMFPEPDSIRLMSWGITLGIAPGQMRKRYDARPSVDYPISLEEAADGSWKLPGNVRPIGEHDTRTLRAWDPKWMRYQWADESWWLMTADGEIRIEPNQGEWLLYTPYGETKPWEYGAWKALTLAWILGRDAIFDRARHAEVLAPVRVGKVPSGTTERQRRKYLDQIRAMQRMHAFVLPPGLDYEIVESTGKVADIYEAIIAWAERDYTVALTGTATTATGSPGFAKGDVQERFTRSVLSAFASSLSTCLHRGGLVPWGVENYGSEDAPRAEFDTAAPEDKKVRAETIKAAGEALVSMAEGLKTAGKQLSAASVEKYAQSLGFEVEDIPQGNAPVAKLDLAPTDIAKVVKANEVRRSQGLPAFDADDPRGEATIAELDAMNKSADAPDGDGAQPPPDVDDGADVGPGDAPPTDEDAEMLAAKMTKYGIERCEHKALNRCRLCGIERVRDFDPGRKPGLHRWKLAWRPIRRAPVVPLRVAGGDA